MDVRKKEYRDVEDKYLRLEGDYNYLLQKSKELESENSILKIKLHSHCSEMDLVKGRLKEAETLKPEPKKTKVIIKRKPDFSLRANTLMDIWEKRTSEQLAGFALSIWRLKYELRKNKRENIELEKMNTANPLLRIEGLTEENAGSIAEGSLVLLAFLRNSLMELIFEIFVRSVNHAHKKKM